MPTAPQQTVFVTGASGFIARHVLLELLNRGYRVRGSLRSLSKADSIRADLRAHLADPSLADTALEFVALDLTADAGWADAMAGVDALMHTASPFPLVQPKDRDALIRPAVDGTTRALGAAADAGVTRVILTSSVAAIVTQAPLDRDTLRTAADWTDPDHPATTAYGASKTLAERAAWKIAAARGLQLTTVNPGMVLGPPLGGEFGSSVSIVQRLLKGRDPALPAVQFDVVDVRDVARIHVGALEHDTTIGKRLIASAGAVWMRDMGLILKSAFPDRPVTTRAAPAWLIRLVGLYDPAVRSILPTLGKRMGSSGAETAALLGMTFIPAETALTDAAQHLIDHNLV